MTVAYEGQAMPQLPRIAMVTPLPPELTGIADYVAILLPGLAGHFQVDLYTTAGVDHVDLSGHRFRAFPWQQLEACRHQYQEVIYQFGNSPFHSHMVELLDRVPGIVVLHDFYLSSMLAHMDLHEGHPGLFEQELERSHGAIATTMLKQQGAWETARHFPASRRIMERARAVIVHSRHSGELRNQFFPGLDGLAWAEVPMPQRSVRMLQEEERRDVRAGLGFGESDFVVISLGFLADTKLNHVLLQALAEEPLASDASLRVVFVGENDGGEYGQSLLRQMQALGMGDRLGITGFVDSATYEAYLSAADCAVQLRTRSRGETSKAVHDCMSNGLPTIVNDYASFSELPDGTVYRTGTQPDAAELAGAIAALRHDPLKRSLLGLFAKHEMYTAHSAARVAARYAAVVEGVAAIAAPPGPAPDPLPGPGTHVPGKRLLIDLSEVVNVDYGTGIHRVVRNLTRSLLQPAVGAGWSCLPIAHGEDGHLVSAWPYARKALGVHVDDGPFPQTFLAGDRLLMLDSAWQQPERFLHSVQRTQQAGGMAGVMLYDLIPLRFPQYCVDYMQPLFERWLRWALAHVDFVVCISRAVADDLHAWIGEFAPRIGRDLRIGHVRLGADMESGLGAEGDPGQAMRAAMAGGKSVLMVGTVEPRKRYDVALDAFEKHWNEGGDACLVIVGKEGWNVPQLAQRLRNHAQAGKKLFWMEYVSNAELTHAYQQCACLLQTSETEGFGLPIVEAARYLKPLLLSDIAVFREIAGDQASYFRAGEVTDLARALAAPLRPPATPMAMVTWKDCASELLGLLDGASWDHAVVARDGKDHGTSA